MYVVFTPTSQVLEAGSPHMGSRSPGNEIKVIQSTFRKKAGIPFWLPLVVSYSDPESEFGFP